MDPNFTENRGFSIVKLECALFFRRGAGVKAVMIRAAHRSSGQGRAGKRHWVSAAYVPST